MSGTHAANNPGWARVLRRDPCAYCRAAGRSGTLDHITAWIAGGRGSLDNLTGACPHCNERKGDLPLLHALLGIGTRHSTIRRGP